MAPFIGLLFGRVSAPLVRQTRRRRRSLRGVARARRNGRCRGAEAGDRRARRVHRQARRARLSSRGKPVFVNVWGSWCEGCNAEAPVLTGSPAPTRARSRSSGSTRSTRNRVRVGFYKRFDLEYPSIWDPRGMIAGAWSRGAPTTLVFDRRHRLVQRIEGSATLKQLNAALRRASPDDDVLLAMTGRQTPCSSAPTRR